MQTQTQLELNYTQFPYSVMVSPRAKRMKIVLRDGCMQLRVPKGTSQKRIDLFVQEQHAWICKARDLLPKKKIVQPFPQRWVPGSTLLFWGKPLPLAFEKCEGRKIDVRSDDAMRIALPKKKSWHQCERQIETSVYEFLKEQLQKEIDALIKKHEGFFSKPRRWCWTYGRGKWGHCTSEGVMAFHWKLICCPKEVVEYVVVHEMAHLKECNHSKRFWKLVKEVLPTYEVQENWLKEHSDLLR